MILKSYRTKWILGNASDSTSDIEAGNALGLFNWYLTNIIISYNLISYIPNILIASFSII
jgi:hypothetical protein